MANELQRLQQWYRAQCNGDWEHSYGVMVDTLDNPGWRLRIDLEETDLATSAFSPLSVERSDTDWVHCKVEQSIPRARRSGESHRTSRHLSSLGREEGSGVTQAPNTGSSRRRPKTPARLNLESLGE
jgi:hypothetical protein